MNYKTFSYPTRTIGNKVAMTFVLNNQYDNMVHCT